MARLLTGACRASGVLAALFVVALAVVVLTQVGLNLIDVVASWVVGAPLGLLIPSYAELAGFFLACASFLALPSTWRAGGHIRVALVLQRMPPRIRHLMDVWSAFVATGIAGFAAYYAAHLAYESFTYGDISAGLLAIPLWLPQSAVALGLAVLTLALLDHSANLLRRFSAARVAGQGDAAECNAQPFGPLPVCDRTEAR